MILRGSSCVVQIGGIAPAAYDPFEPRSRLDALQARPAHGAKAVRRGGVMPGLCLACVNKEQLGSRARQLLQALSRPVPPRLAVAST
jgi:hypothetical protein